MPSSVTPVNGCNAAIFLDDPSGNLRDVSGNGNRFNMELTQVLGEYTTFGDGWMRRMACKRDGSFTVRFLYDRDTNSGWDLIRDWFFNYPKTARRLQIRLPEDAIGGDIYTAYCLLETIPVDVSADEAAPIMVEVALRPTGEITFSTVTT